MFPLSSLSGIQSPAPQPGSIGPRYSFLSPLEYWGLFYTLIPEKPQAEGKDRPAARTGGAAGSSGVGSAIRVMEGIGGRKACPVIEQTETAE